MYRKQHRLFRAGSGVYLGRSRLLRGALLKYAA